jgi:glycosyltransferase involved in cell wall biosynthesis
MSRRPVGLSIVIPCHNEALNVPALLARLLPVLEAICMPFEVLCIDDGSTDATYEALTRVAAQDSRVKAMRFARNFGKEIALTAGIDYASGDAVIVMDADLQHPPECIATLVAAWREGADMVLAVPHARQADGWLRRHASSAFYRLFNAMSDTPIPSGVGDFRLLDRRVVQSLQALPERTRFMKGLFALSGFNVTSVRFDPEQRVAGRSKFRLGRLWRFAVDGLTSFTSVPLRIWSYLGLALALPAGAYAIGIVVKTIVFGIDVPGYASLATLVLLFSGVQLIGLGVIGEYLGRVYTESKQRPLYVVTDTRGELPQAKTLPHGGIVLPAKTRRALT